MTDQQWRYLLLAISLFWASLGTYGLYHHGDINWCVSVMWAGLLGGGAGLRNIIIHWKTI